MKNIARLTVLVMLFMALVGFSGGGMVAASASATEVTAGTTDEENPWAGLDTSEEVKIVVYAIGNKPNDLNLVLEEVNARMKELINTTIDVYFISLADFSTRYPLLLTGGDDIDLIYTGEWCYYNDQARKGAFYELTDEFIQTYMPESWKNQPAESWKQIKLEGKIYAVPNNRTTMQTFGGFLIRKDLREKYGLSEITTLEELEQYLYAVAENETDIYGLYAFPSLPLTSSFLTYFENWFDFYNMKICWDADNGVAKAEDVFFLYDTEEYKEYALLMAEFAEKGVWPSNAMTGTTQTSDLFTEGKSACMPCRLYEIDSAVKSAEDKGYEVEYVNIFPETTYIRNSPYRGDAMAVTSFSKNKERAAICLDVIKNDETINLLLVGGIEGKHYVLNSDGTRSDGPDAANYTWDGWSWGFRNQWNPDPATSDVYKEADEKYTSQIMPEGMWAFDGFSGDDTPLAAEISVINSLVTEYSTSFDLGAFGSETAAKYDEFIAKLKSAGLDEVMDMWRSQIAEYIGE